MSIPLRLRHYSRVTRIGIDIGGTFTDLYVLSKGGKSWSTKVLTTPHDPSVGFLTILERALAADPDFRAVKEIVHATTVATNAILEGKTAHMGMITTAGFRDVLEIGRHFRRDLYNFFLEKPPVLVPRQRRLEVRERISADGTVLAPLDAADTEAAITKLLDDKVEVILVCLLHSYHRASNRFNGFSVREQTVETVGASASVSPTPLKRRVNESILKDARFLGIQHC